LKLDESQRKRLESLLNTAYSVVKAGKSFSDYELICEIQVKNGLDLGENYRNINGCKTFAASMAQILVDKQVKFQILSYKLGLGKSLTGLGLKKFKKPWAWAYPKNFSTPVITSVRNVEKACHTSDFSLTSYHPGTKNSANLKTKRRGTITRPPLLPF
jgi:hypothetical protein